MQATSRTMLLLGVAALVASVSVLPGTAHAQGRDEYQQWAALFVNGRLDPTTPRLNLWFDAHARRRGNGTLLIFRPAVGLDVAPWLSIYLGYAYVPLFTDGQATLHEHRIWQQATLRHRFDFGLAVQSRTRFEQRVSDAGGDVGLRLRQFVRANWQPKPDIPLGIAFWDELFIGLNDTDWGPAAGMDQNRVFLGPFLMMAPWVRLEAGYLFAYLDRGTTDLYAHTLAVNLFLFLAPPPPPPAPAMDAEQGG